MGMRLADVFWFLLSFGFSSLCRQTVTQNVTSVNKRVLSALQFVEFPKQL